MTTIEILNRMTSRLSDANLTLAEASALRPELERLLAEIHQTGCACPALAGAGAAGDDRGDR